MKNLINYFFIFIKKIIFNEIKPTKIKKNIEKFYYDHDF